jgi:hypothetical protein
LVVPTELAGAAAMACLWSMRATLVEAPAAAASSGRMVVGVPVVAR